MEIKNGSCDLDYAPFRDCVSSIPVLDIIYLCEEFDNSTFSRPRGIIGGPKISKSRDPQHAPLGLFVILMRGFDTANLCTYQ